MFNQFMRSLDVFVSFVNSHIDFPPRQKKTNDVWGVFRYIC